MVNKAQPKKRSVALAIIIMIAVIALLQVIVKVFDLDVDPLVVMTGSIAGGAILVLTIVSSRNRP
jgi:hypothetical protein